MYINILNVNIAYIKLYLFTFNKQINQRINRLSIKWYENRNWNQPFKHENFWSK